MTPKRFPTVIAVIAFLCLLLAVPGCWNPFSPEEDTGDGGGNGHVQYDRSSRMNLMEFFAWSHEQRNLEDYEQFIRRVWRQGQKHRVIVHHVLAEKTVDEVIMKALKTKDRTQRALLDALKDYAKERKTR